MDQLDPPYLDAAALAEVAGTLLRLPARPGWPEPPFLVALPWGDPWRVDDFGFDLEARPLSGDDALDVLCHQQARPEWVAVGAVVEGWTVPPAATEDVDWRTLHRNGPPLRLHPQRRRVRTLHLVARDGAVALALRSHADPEPQVHACDDGGAPDAPTGPLPDGLRRLLGLPTPACPVPAVELWASLWLAAVAARADRWGARLGWADVAALHPAAQMLQPSGLVDPTVDLVEVGRALALARGWEALQLAAISGVERGGLLPPPHVAAWADAGMFARLVLRQVAPLRASRPDLGEHLDHVTLARIDTVLGAWGLHAAPPAGRPSGPRPEHAA